MTGISKQIVTDEQGRPVAVQIAYADWITIEARLGEAPAGTGSTGEIGKYFGVLPLRLDPMAYQEQARDEWS